MMSISLPQWVGQNFLSDAQATEDGLLGFVNPIFKTIGENFGTPVIQTGWECYIFRDKKSFIMWNCSEGEAKKAVESFISGIFAVDMLD